MAQRVHIVSDPERPQVGKAAKLSVHVNGEPVDADAPVVWQFMRRDDEEPHWPLGDQGKGSVTIARWTSEHHGTYYADISTDEGPRRAARTIPPALRVALSGGGYRATMFGLGALLYLVDVNAHHRIEDLSSVSGGSIANAIVLDGCDLSTTTREEFWRIVSNACAQMTRSRILPHTRLSETIRVCIVVVLAIVILVGLWVSFGIAVVAITCAALSIAAMFRGFAVERMLRRRFRLTRDLDAPRRRVTHVFCATDLVAGEPFFFLSTLGGGFFYSRRRGAARAGYSVPKAIRASAAFPFAFLPKRVGLRRHQFEWSQQPGTQDVHFPGIRAYCADGGVANNLGTQWFEEQDPADWPYRMIFGSRLAGGVRWRPARETIDIAVDASLPIAPVSNRWFAVPLIAELRSLSRVMRVLYENTLIPRRVEATWEESVLADKGYAAIVAEHGASVERRGSHHRVLVPLDAELLSQAGELTESAKLLFVPPDVLLRGITLPESLRPLDAVDGHLESLRRAGRIPTTLFKRSRGETVDALLAGYLGAFINCHRYEGLGVPSTLVSSVERIRSLEKRS